MQPKTKVIEQVPTTNGENIEPNLDFIYSSQKEWLDHLNDINKNREKQGLNILLAPDLFPTVKDYNFFIEKINKKHNEIDFMNNNNPEKLRMQCYEEIKEMWFSATDNKQQKFNEIVERIVAYFHEVYTFKSIKNDDKVEIWFYEEGIYKPNAISKIKEDMRLIFDDRINISYINSVVLRIEISNYIDSDDFFNQQKKEPYLIPINDCLFNLKTREKQDFTPKKYFFNKIPVDYSEKAECPNIKKFIKEITTQNGVEKTKNIDCLQELFGYCLVKNYKYQNAFMFEGARGSNGKTVLCDLMKTFVNEKNVTNVKIDSLDKEDSFNLQKLQHKLINFSSEVSENALDNKGNFKKITGGDGITANRKFKNSVDFVNYAKMIFTANKLPIPKNTDDGFWRRWVRIEFPNRYLSQSEIDKLTDHEKQNVYLKDSNMIDKLKTEKELNGLFLWAIEGLDRLEENGDFTRERSITQEETSWKRKTNSILCFCTDEIEQDFDSYISKEEFRKQYAIYCKNHNIKPMGDKAIKYHLENELFAEEKRKTINILNKKTGYNEYERPLVWSGVKFKNIHSNKLGDY